MSGPDLTRLPKGQRAWNEFAQELRTLDDGAERHYLEFKSELDPTSKPGAAKIAKFILGAANRSISRAERVLEGFALFVVGISKGELVGIPAFEVKDLEQIVCKFVGVGTDGPGWDLHYVPALDARQVLIIQVDPPKATDTLWTCRADGDGLKDGAIYLRVEGATRDAHGNEIRALLAEKVASAQPEAEVDVTVTGIALRCTCDSSVIDDYIDKQRERLLEAMPKPKPRSPARDAIAGYGGIFAGMDQFTAITGAYNSSHDPYRQPEKRTVEQYHTEIDQWEAQVRARWTGAVDRIAGYSGNTVQIKVVNRSQLFMEDVEVQVHVEGAIVGVKAVGSGKFAFSAGLPDTP